MGGVILQKDDSNLQRLPLRPRARLLRILGEELISSESVAIIELVKNAYDADATRVLVRFIGPLEIGKGAIEVMDNGHGMSMDVIRNAWMEPATGSKRARKRSETRNRRLLGQKGIGRFAAARLATELRLITRRRSSETEVHANFDWTQFDDETKYLDEILVETWERPPEAICPGGAIESLWGPDDKPKRRDLSTGTILRMEGLKRPYTAQDFEDLQRGLARLVSPFFKDSDLRIRLELPEAFAEHSDEVSPPRIIRYPHYIMKGSVCIDGRFELSIKVRATGEEQRLRGVFGRETDSGEMLMIDTNLAEPVTRGGPKVHPQIRPECGPFAIQLRIWDRDELGNIQQATHSTISDIRRDLDSIAGINIYRDGFRVLPYGEPKDDWLRLDLRRVQKPTVRLSNNQIVGYVRISADDNPQLRDQSNREGLDENRALMDLRECLLHMLTRVEAIRYPIRPRQQASRKTPVGGLFAAVDLRPLREHLTTTHPQDARAIEVLDQTSKALEQQLEEIQTVVARYQRLATLGQLIDVVLHDGRQPVAKIVNEALHGWEEVEGAQGSNGKLLPRLGKRFQLIGKQGDVLSTVFRRMEPFGGRRRGRPTQLYLEKVIVEAFAVFNTEIKKFAVKVSLPRTETLVRLDEAEMQEVITNLLQNSLYWLQHIRKDLREIVVSIQRIGPDNVQIIFADSGPGVSKKNRRVIFEPYFSTKPNGVGLGLTIAGEIVNDFYGGKLELVDKGPLKGAVFRVTLRKRV